MTPSRIITALLCAAALAAPFCAHAQEPAHKFTSRAYATESDARNVADGISRTGAPLGLRFARLTARKQGQGYVFTGSTEGALTLAEYNSFSSYATKQEAAAAAQVLVSAFKSAGVQVLASVSVADAGRYTTTVYYSCPAAQGELKRFTHHSVLLHFSARSAQGRAEIERMKSMGLPVIESGWTAGGFKIAFLSKGTPMLASGKKPFGELAQATAELNARRDQLAAANALVIFSSATATAGGYNYAIFYIE